MSDKTNQPASWYAIRRKTAQAAASAGVQSAAEILIYGDIGESWWEETTSARSFVAELQALDVDAITVRINSLGGSVPDGLPSTTPCAATAPISQLRLTAWP